MAPRHTHESELQVGRVERHRLRNLPSPPTPPPLPVSVDVSSLLLPTPIFLDPSIHDELKAIEEVRSNIFRSVGLQNWTMDGSDVSTARVYKSDGIPMDISTFLHLERCEVRKILRVQTNGLSSVRALQDAWAASGRDILALGLRLEALLERWTVPDSQLSGLDGRMQPCRVFRLHSVEASHQLWVLRSLASMMCMVVEEEIYDWRAEGQWKAGSNESVKNALTTVGHIFVYARLSGHI